MSGPSGNGAPAQTGSGSDDASKVSAKSAEDARLKEYEYVTAQFRKLTEIRFQLLGLLPAGTVGTLGFLEHQDSLAKVQAPFAVFGLTITLAMATYNLRNDQLYDALVGRAAQLERMSGLYEGSFSQRPGRWQRLGLGIHVEHRWPIALVYAATAALWFWVAVSPHPGSKALGGHAGEFAAVAALFFGFGVMSLLKRSEKASRKRYRAAVKEGMRLLRGAPLSAGGKAYVPDVARALAQQLGLGNDAIAAYEKRLEFYLELNNLKDFAPTKGETELTDYLASFVLAQTIDMPAWWIRDVASGRRA